MQPLSNKKRRWYLYIFTVLFFVLIPVVILFVQGYRLDKGFLLVRVGGMYVGGIDSDAEIFLNGILQKNVKSLKKGFFIENILPARYQVSIKKEWYTPWSKEIMVHAEKVSEMYPLLIPRKLKTQDIPAEIERDQNFFDSATSTTMVANDMFTRILTLFKKNKVSEPLIRRSVVIWNDANKIQYRLMEESPAVLPSLCGSLDCTATSTVYITDKKITHIDFYPGRNDVILFAVSDGIYAVEMDNRPPQQVVQIYSGKNPDFRVENNENLYIKEGQRIFQVEV